MELVTGKDNEILRTPSQPVEKITPEIRELIRQMKKLMKQYGGIGLAAPQLGINLQIFVAQAYSQERGYQGKFYALLNPKIINLSQQTEKMEEGCLSLPHLYGEVERPKRIVLEALDEFGNKVKLKASGLLARIFQHEIDHLNGKLFIDRTKRVKELK